MAFKEHERLETGDRGNVFWALHKGDLVLSQLASDASVPHVTPWFRALSREQVRVSVSHPQ